MVQKRQSESRLDEVLPKEELPTHVKQLQEELRKAKLHNKLLNAIIDIAEASHHYRNTNVMHKAFRKILS